MKNIYKSENKEMYLAYIEKQFKISLENSVLDHIKDLEQNDLTKEEVNEIVHSILREYELYLYNKINLENDENVKISLEEIKKHIKNTESY